MASVEHGSKEVCYPFANLSDPRRSTPMLLSHCPNCQYDNRPGERFCAACGVPLDLKPCPVCGKVDSVKATSCAGCGTQFPPLDGAPYPDEPGVHDGAQPTAATTAVVQPPQSSMRALPLVIVALAAGGIPLLWAYRNEMPVPKAWQARGPAADTPAPVPASPVIPILPVKPEPSPVATENPAATPALIPLPPPTNPPTAREVRPQVVDVAPENKLEPPKKAAPALVVPAKPPTRTPSAPPPAVKPAIKPVAKPATKPAPMPIPSPSNPDPEVKTPAAPECTEALAAVGLCDPKAAK